MKKIIFLGLLLFVALFSYSSKELHKKQRNRLLNGKQLILNRNEYLLNKFDDPIQNTTGISVKQRPVKHFSRHRKGKIIYIKNNTKTHNVIFE
jgi:hypothetical protein